SHLFSQSANFVDVQIVHELVYELGRGVAERYYSVAGEFIEHALSILEFHSGTRQPIGVRPRRSIPSVIARLTVSESPFPKSRPRNATEILREPLTSVTNNRSLAAS